MVESKRETKQQYTVMLKPSTVEEIDRLASKLELTRSQLMGNLIESGLDDAKLLDRLGGFGLIKAGGKLASKIRHGLLSGKLVVTDDGEVKSVEGE